MRRAIFLGFVLFAASHLLAQAWFPVDGYITSVHLPASFQAGGRTVVLTRQTSFGYMGSNITSASDPARMSLRVGAYVQVAGRDPGLTSPVTAETVFIRDDRNLKLSGIGVITRVVAPPPEPIYEADGYLIRISESTHLNFAGDLSSISEITDNTWIHFTGKRNASGILEATHAQFIPAKPTKFKAIKGVEVAPVQMRPASSSSNAPAPAGNAASNSADGASLQEDEQVKIGLGRWRTIPADQPLQQRVHRIGMALVPAYQRRMDDSDPSKIHFRFFAVDDKKMRGSECLPDGVVLVSTEAIQRLPNDDQLAAVLAAGIACHLQRQAARAVIAMRTELGIELAADVAEAFFPPAALAGAVGSASAEKEEKLAEERLRVALALMQDARYDPWQSPEAWRILEPKKLPANLASLEYPDASCYQISILNLQYPRTLQNQKQ
jgi:hypothetical protein